MSLKGDDEFIVIHIDENSEISEIANTKEYIQMNTIKTSVQENNQNVNEEQLAIDMIEKVIDEVLDDVMEELAADIASKNILPIITEQPTKINTESQTNITYSIHETDKEQDNISLDDQEYENMINEEEPCLYHYKPAKSFRNRNRNRNIPSNKSDCLSGLKRFIKYILHF